MARVPPLTQANAGEYAFDFAVVLIGVCMSKSHYDAY